MGIFFFSAVVGQHAHFFYQIRVGGSHRTSIAEGSGPLALIHGSLGLGNVLDNVQLMFCGQGHEGIHVGGNSIQVHRDDGLCFGGNRLLGGLGIEGKGTRGNIGKNNLGTG